MNRSYYRFVLPSFPLHMNQSSSPFRAAYPVGAFLISAFLSSCASAPPPPIPKTTVSANVPVISVLPETKEAQEKGGVEIAIVPVSYSTAVRQKYSVTPKSPGMGSMLGAAMLTGGKSSALVYVEETTTPFLDVTPGRLQFTVRVNNKLSRVFRGQGAVVQFNVAGKLVPFGETDYAEVLNGIVPPRNENTFNIKGPKLETIPDKGTIGIFLYDVVTQTDTAGNVIEKQNYEWFFDYAVKKVEAQGERQKNEAFMEPGLYQQALIKARKRAMDDPDPPELYMNLNR